MRKLALVLGLFLCCAVGRAQYIQPKVVGGSGGGGGTGTVTSVTSANARATVANSTTTPVITIVSAPIADSVINQAILLAGKQNAGTYLGPGDTTNLHNLAAGALQKSDSAHYVVAVNGQHGSVTVAGGGAMTKNQMLDSLNNSTGVVSDLFGITDGSSDNEILFRRSSDDFNLRSNGRRVLTANGSFTGLWGANSTAGLGGQVALQGSFGTTGPPGNVAIYPGTGGGGTLGVFEIYSEPNESFAGAFDVNSVSGSDKTYRFPDSSGTVALLQNVPAPLDTTSLSLRIDEKVNTSDSGVVYVTPAQLNDTAAAIRGSLPVGGAMTKQDVIDSLNSGSVQHTNLTTPDDNGGGNGGNFNITLGETADGVGGGFNLSTGYATGNGTSGAFALYAGNSVNGAAGSIVFTGGFSTNSTGSIISLNGGGSTNGSGGSVSLTGGASDSGNGGDVNIAGGAAPLGTHGAVNLASNVNVTGALGVTGTISGDGSGLTNLPSDANKVNYTDSNTIYVTPTGLNNAIPAVSKVLFDRFADTSNSGTSETIAYRSTITYNGDDLFFSDPGAKLNVQFSGTVVGSATASKRFRVYINTDTSGGALIYDSGAITMSSSSSWILDATAFTGMASGATNGFKTSGALNSNGLAVGSDTYSGTPTSPDYNPGDPIAVTLTITETGTGSGSNHITASTGTATLIPGANPNH